MNNCEQETITLAQVITGGVISASLIQWARQLWERRAQASLPQVREVAYALDLAPDGTCHHDTYREHPLLISKVRQGGPPWHTFPPELNRAHLERLYDVHVRAGILPTEKAMLSRDVLTRAELRVLRDFLYHTGRAAYLRNGANAPWQLTPQGRADVIFWYLRLNGKIPTTPPLMPKQITR